MPGIQTHIQLFTDAMNAVKSDKNPGRGTRSLEILFATPLFARAGYFGCLGPDVIDYLPLMKKKSFFGTALNKDLHSARLAESLRMMLTRVLHASDPVNEWSAAQRAFVYGYVSHIVTDAVFHPFIYYWAGFPDTDIDKEVMLFREQFLLLEYTIDAYFTHFYKKKPVKTDLKSLFPIVTYGKGRRGLHPSIAGMLYDLLIFLDHEIGDTFFFRMRHGTTGNQPAPPTCIRMLPYIIDSAFRLKTSNNRYYKKIVDRLRKKKLLFPDYTVRYPEPKRINRHVLNLHRERWFYPAGAPGLHYESVEDLYKIAQNSIVAAWDKLESAACSSSREIAPLLHEIAVDALTGEIGKQPHEMHVKNPVKPRL